jgi:hypothetical protein
MNPISIQNPRPLPAIPATPTRKERVVLAQMLTQLMLHWKLPIKAQCALLGLHESSKGRIYRYRRGSPLSTNRDQMDRAALLLSIHAHLRVLFPKNREIVYSWMSDGNKVFNGQAPVAVAQAYGIVGLQLVARHLRSAGA